MLTRTQLNDIRKAFFEEWLNISQSPELKGLIEKQ